MVEDAGDILRWIQEHFAEAVTEQLVATLRRLYKNNKDNLPGFIEGCNAFGKLRGQDDFIRRLFERLAGAEKGSLSEEHVVKSEPARKKRLGEMSSRVPLNYDSDDNDDDTVDNYPKETPVNVKSKFRMKEVKNDGEMPRMKFKKIKKEVANKLKEYSSTDGRLSISNGKPSNRSNSPSIVHAQVPELQSFYMSISQEPENNDDGTVANSSESDVPEEEQLSEDRGWYNCDDDYGNPVLDDSVKTKELDFTPANQTYMRNKEKATDANDSYTEIQVYALPMSRRKELIPRFLQQYIETRGISNATLIGSFLQSSRDGFTSPFKNPDGVFAINARKGSKLVAIRRLARDQSKSSRQTAEVAGTAVGNVLGIKEDKTENPIAVEIDAKSDKIELTRADIELSRRKLPSYAAKSALLQLIRDNQIMVIIGETGSGKTTQLAQYIYEAGICAGGQLIGCTQPRRVAAISVAKRVALEMDAELGQEVGYAIRFEDETSEKTKIKFMTDGILLREALLDETLEKYGCIVIDEAHERSLNTDIVLGMLKRLLSRRRDLKVIITSATMNAAKFSKFFGSAPLFTIPGRTYPKKLIYSKSPVEDYVEAAVMQTVSIHVSTEIDSGDILIFMTGQEDIEATFDAIKERLAEVYSRNSSISTFNDIDNVEIFTIYSALPGDIQNRIFESLPSGKRKIVIATNIAETSLTIDGIRYVIDPGYAKMKIYNSRIGLDSLTVCPIARANADQRSGRASRTSPGTTYRLYPESTVEEDMFAQTIPEIQRTNLSNTVLLLKTLGIDDIMEFPFIDAPPLQTFLSSLYELFFIGALDASGKLTSLGVAMSRFPLQPSLSKILLIASQNGCSEEMLTIVSMLSVPQVFYRPKERMRESDLSRRRFFVAESDHLTLLNVYSQWKCNKYSHRWCNKYFLHYKSLQRAREIREQLKKIMAKNRIKLVSAGPDWSIIRKCICSGFAQQCAKRSGLSKYVHLKTGMDIQLHPTSALYGMGDLPSYIIYHELLMTKTEYACCVTAVDPFWLMEYGPLLYDIKRVAYVNDSQRITQVDVQSGNLPQKEDELEHRLKRCIAEKTRLIQTLKLQQDSKDIIPKSEISTSNKKKQRHTAHIGLKRKRPF